MKRSSRPLRVEPLERRDLMAGVHEGTGLPYHTVIDLGIEGSWNDPPANNNVTVEVIDGRLVVRGDAGDNKIVIAHGPDGSGVIQGVNRATTINGKLYGIIEDWNAETLENWVFSYSGATAGIDIDLGAGDDDLHSIALDAPDVNIRTGAGDDRVSFGDFGGMASMLYNPRIITMSIKYPRAAKIDGNLLVDTGEGNDTVSAFAEVSGNAEIRLEAGDDTLEERPLTVYEYAFSTVMRVGGNQVIDFGTGEEGLPDPLTESGANSPEVLFYPPPANIVFPPGAIQPPMVPPQPPEPPPGPPTGVVIVDNPSIYTYTKVSPKLVEVAYDYFVYWSTLTAPFVPPAGIQVQDGRILVEVTSSGEIDDLMTALVEVGLEFQPIANDKVVGWLPYGRLHSLEALDEVEWVTPAEAEFVGPLAFRDE